MYPSRQARPSKTTRANARGKPRRAGVSSPLRKEPRQARARVMIEEILEAARRVLIAEGYERASTNRIAEVAGVSVGSLYQYFGSKEAIVTALVERHLTTVMGIVGKGLAEAATEPLDEAARRLSGLMIDAHRVEPELHRALDAHRARFEANAHVLDVNRTIRLMLRGYLAERRHELRADLDLDIATFLIHELVEHATHAAVLDEPELLAKPKLVEEMAKMIVAYVSPRDEPRR